MKAISNRLIALTVAMVFSLPVAYCQDASAPTQRDKNLIQGGDCESFAEGPTLSEERFDTIWCPVSPYLSMKETNTFFNVSTEKAHSGNQSIRVALNPTTAKMWQKWPPKPDTTDLFIHYVINPKTKIANALAPGKIVFSVWVYVEKGSFTATVRARASDADGPLGDLINGVLNTRETGKWVELRLEGWGSEGVVRSDVRLQIECRGDFVVYLDDFYYGPAK